MHRELVTFLFTATIVGALAGQRPLTPESFRPDQAEGELRVDLQRLRATGVWDEVEHSLLKTVLLKGEEETGMDFAELDTVWMWIRVEDEGVRRLTAVGGEVDGARLFEKWNTEEAAGRTLRVHRWSDRQLGLLEPGLLVLGDRQLMLGALDAGATGLPRPDQLSLLASTEPALAHFYAHLPSARVSNGGFGFLTEIDYPADDEAEHLVLRLDVVGDALDPHLQLSAIVRHRRGGPGLEATEAAARAWLTDLQEIPEMALFRRLLDGVRLERDGLDLRAEVDLGRARDAIGTLAQAAVPWFMLRPTAARAQAQAAEARLLEAERALRAMQEAAEKEAGAESGNAPQPEPEPEPEPSRPAPSRPKEGGGG